MSLSHFTPCKMIEELLEVILARLDIYDDTRSNRWNSFFLLMILIVFFTIIFFFCICIYPDILKIRYFP